MTLAEILANVDRWVSKEGCTSVYLCPSDAKTLCQDVFKLVTKVQGHAVDCTGCRTVLSDTGFPMKGE